MIRLTQRAGKHVNAVAIESGMADLALRVAVKKNADGNFEYGVGFDEVHDGDTRIESEGVQVVVSEESRPLLEGTVVDFVEIEDGKPHFIFLNPCDPNYVPPVEGDIADIPPKNRD